MSFKNIKMECSRESLSGRKHSQFKRFTEKVPMLTTPCESVQICTDPDRYSRIVRKLNSLEFSFRK